MHRDQLKIASPCSADWQDMNGDSRRRFCGQCAKHVHDLSAMTAQEARDLVTRERGLCVRYAVHPDGRVKHRPVLTNALRALTLGASLVALPAAASTTPDVEPGPIMESLRSLIEQAMQLADPEEELMGEPVIALDQLEEACEDDGCGSVAPPEVELMGDVAIEEPIPELEEVKLGEAVLVRPELREVETDPVSSELREVKVEPPRMGGLRRSRLD